MSSVRPATYLDSHAHIQAHQFGGDAAAVIGRAVAAGVGTIICASDDEPSSRDALALAEQWPDIWATVGVHPHEAAAADVGTLERLTTLAASPRVVAVGEIGLDYFRDLSPRLTQRTVFRLQLDLSSRLGLPVVIHSRDAAADTYAMLRDWREDKRAGGAPGVMHCFGYDVDWAERFMDLGFMISIAGTVTYPKAEQVRAVAQFVPQTGLLVETDSPYLAPQPWRGKRNEPAYLPQTIAVVAALRGVTPQQLGSMTAVNARRLFRLEPVAAQDTSRRRAP